MRFLCVLLLVGLVATPQPNMEKGRVSRLPTTDRLATDAEAPGGRPIPVGHRSDPPPATFGRIAPIVAAGRITGTATWYCSATSPCTRGYSPSDLVAAIDPSTGFHKGDQLRVRSGGKSVVVTIVDVCLCRGERVIDLTSGAFRRLAPLSRGVIPVSLELVGGIDVPLTRPAPTARPVPTAPQTDLEVK